ncbi:zinc dependent phospholipase C family protein [Pseudalkalibacillus hwajinpoensis]|uniref:zinc dependent phospholipase C family protein n=1 Tax=Guptibacillus hwajinpoensis TaxID=208199 RepID=UPI00325AF9EC
MGSRIMHLLIARRLSDQITITDKEAFLAGSIAPDAVSGEAKDRSHFYEGHTNDFTRRVNHEAFIQKYCGQLPNDYLLGYYIHLISDELWLNGFYFTWLRNRMEEREGFYEIYHEDFRRLNRKLANAYGVNASAVQLTNHQSILDLDEVPRENVIRFLPYVVDDFIEREDQPLTVFTLDQIVGYIESSVSKGKLAVQRLFNEETH